MSFEQNISQDSNTDGHSSVGRGGGGSGSAHHRLVVVSLGLLNAALLIAAVVIGIYCAKDDYLRVPDSATTPLLIEMNYLRNHSDIFRAKLQAQAELARERSRHVALKLQVKQMMTHTDILQKQIEILRTERANLQSNKTTLEKTCDRCQQGWVLLKSSCYYFSHVSNSKKNWLDSRAHCVSQGGDLLVINDLMEQQLMIDNYPRVRGSGMWWQNGFWIGLTDVTTPGTWVWVNNVTEEEMLYWRSGQPNHEGPQSGHCAAFYHFNNIRGTWYNGNCRDHLNNWICEMVPI